MPEPSHHYSPNLPSDPLERIVAVALNNAGIKYIMNVNRLDFYLPEHNVYIEVKRAATDRIIEQCERVPNVIVVQGIVAAGWLGMMIGFAKGQEL